MVSKDLDLDDLVNFINSDKKGPSKTSNVKKPKVTEQEIINEDTASNIVKQFDSKANIQQESLNEIEEIEKKKKKRRKNKNKKDDEDDENEEDEIKKAEEAKKRNFEMYNTFFNIDRSILKDTKYQDNSQFRVLANWKEVDNDKGEVYRQTNIPSIQIDDQFKDGVFPVGQIMNYTDQEWRVNSEEKRALERIQHHDLQKLRNSDVLFE